jgi:hypothetical protein
VKRALIIAGTVVAVLVISALLGRWLNNDTVERALVVDLLKAQAKGDAPAMLRIVKCPDAACVALVRANAKRLHVPGEVKIALYESQTAHALSSRTRPTRVVWYTHPSGTTVQCVLVRRSGDVLAGASITLLRLSAPIGREASCP